MKYNCNNIVLAIYFVLDAIEKTIHANVDENFSLIGKRIKPSDNSYAKCLDSGCDARVYKKEFICMSEPYTTKVKAFLGDETRDKDMIKVFSLRSGRMYEVLFNECDLVDD
jgi:hypothetical protein